MRITVVGSGAWGTALGCLLEENGHEVTLWSYTQNESDTIAAGRENPLLPGVRIPDSIKLTSDLSLARGSQIIVLATPSYAVRSTAAKLREYLEPDTVIVSVTKGIEADTGCTMSQIIEQETGARVAVLSGPSHAEEVGRRIPTGVVAASRDQKVAELVQDTFMCDRFRVYTSPDVIGIELGAALKNVIALCAGCCDGLGLGDNTKALLMTRGLTEMARLGIAMGGRRETFAGLAGVGDLIVTCTSMHSRNRRAGILIGQGMDIQAAMKQVGAVVEGYYATKSAWQLAKKAGIEMPIVNVSYAVLYEGQSIHTVAEQLMLRAKRQEQDDGTWA
ncbi:MAG: NAD(P)-dependent glycerol-3-phosphate dehydrogenase [Oscillospiraceae bacterium]|nr:NAD(P)-dependent glycerol-3-phosphate dehydrogenase [Oscillospiraceae bacterium]